ncbi:MAG: hypothetical protein JWM75_200 [Sphingomonas bacterium]|nr:hypothetical protein [Sphingomonas bacterium]
MATRRLTLRPYYPPEIAGDHDWDLLRSAGRAAMGQVLQVEGQVLLASATIEIWQVDAKGRYLRRGETFGGC